MGNGDRLGLRRHPAELIERDVELRVIDRAIDRAAEGSGAAIVIEGPAGIGKTVLLRAARERAEARGPRPLRATGRELEQGFSFGVARQLFEPVLGSLDAADRERVLSGAAAPVGSLLGAVPGPTAPADIAFALTHALYWLTANLAEMRPLLLAVDDLQWADAPSRQALEYLVPRVEDLPVVVVCAVRSGEPEAADLVRRLGAETHIELLRPAPLSPEAVGAVVREELPPASDAFCDACHRAAAGNPFLARELALAAIAEGIAGEEADAARLGSLAPDSVTRSVFLRLRRLGGAARSLAQALAVLERADLEQAAALADLDRDDAASAADALTKADILAAGLPLRFAHPVLRAAVYEDINPASRDGAHRKAAKLLVDAGADVEVVASHLRRCESRGEPWAAEALRGAGGRALAAGSPEAAAATLRRALDERADGNRAALLHELGRAEAACGDSGAADRLAAAYEAADDPDTRAEILTTLGEARFVTGDLAASVAAFREALETSKSPLGSDPEVQTFLGYVMVARAYAPAAGDAQARIRSRAKAPDNERGLEAAGRAAALAYDGFLAGEPVEGVRDAASHAVADEQLLEAGGPAAQAFYLVTWALAGADGFDPAEAALQYAFDRAAGRGSFLEFGLACHHRLWSRWRRGRVLEALADAEIALELAGRGWELIRPAAAWARAECLIETGDLGGAADALEQAERLPPGLAESCVEGWLLMGRSRLELERGAAQTALDCAVRCGSLMTSLHAENPAVAEWRSRAAQAAAAVGEHDRARELWEEELRLSRDFGAPRAIGIALRSGGLVEGGRRGLELLGEAADVLKGSPAQLEHARVLVDLGTALRRARQPREAREPLRRGAQLAAERGAAPLAARAREEALAAGARPRREAFTGAESLTPRELRIAELAAQGLGNREIAQALFITRKTVEAHMRNIFRKLDIGSRDELPGVLPAGKRRKR